ncbi:DUF1902 domain-containing protein [Dolichospermum planctonicum CS-1226]|uniref:DUF1902 domain-containing protein n=1 Tax=Dolichospermum planctonicum CS-1226 TaxID=3021751 RepID=A0ABT5AI03_9CYAN|nr:DUF1902 domain-containing protein [Dolichospermum planctonicum]MDB9536924.1 DUF1902 domain-containing protein [Dolichospermum planctonicum CS-1226]
MSELSLKVHAFWDEEAQVWTASSEDVPGLVTEAHDYGSRAFRTESSDLR